MQLIIAGSICQVAQRWVPEFVPDDRGLALPDRHMEYEIGRGARAHTGARGVMPPYRRRTINPEKSARDRLMPAAMFGAEGAHSRERFIGTVATPRADRGTP